MKTVTSITVWNDAVGRRISVTYSEVDDETGKILSDNNRIDRVVTDTTAKGAITSLSNYAQSFVDSI